MRWIKKILRIITIILPSLVCTSTFLTSPSHALQHEFYTLPYYKYYSPSQSSGNGSIIGSSWLSITLTNNAIQSFNISNMPVPLVFSVRKGKANTNTTCYRQNQLGVKGSYGGNQYGAVFPTYDKAYSYNDQSSLEQNGMRQTYCMRLGLELNNLDPTWSNGNNWLMSWNPYLINNPYYYEYDSYYIHSYKTQDSTGVTYNHSLKMSELFGNKITEFKQLNIPLAINFDNVGDFTSGRQVEFKGLFNFGKDGFEWGSRISDTGSYFRVVLTDKDGNNQYSSCTALKRQVGSDFTLEYSCPVTISNPIVKGDRYSINLELNTIGSLDDYVLRTTADWSFAGSYIVTDGDDTPSTLPASNDCTGSNCSNATGSIDSVYGDINANNGGLSNLFDFNMMNPFAPLFGMFTTSSCVQIPTLANMLHSTETEYCSWWSSDVRNVVTPVIGLSSMMLLFGFVIRWLSGNSGSILVDNDVKDTGSSFSLENKYSHRRKR